MFNLPFLLIAAVFTVVLGGAASVWLWSVHRRKLVVAAGLRALGAMRWREFSRFVVEALEQQRFVASRRAPDPHRGELADLLLNRDGGIWLLNCKQGLDYEIEADVVDKLANAVRDSSARGGVFATLGRFTGEARRNDQGLELIDGRTLWPQVAPLLPPSLHEDLEARARKETTRYTLIAWLAALALGLVLASVLGATIRDRLSPQPAPPAATATAPPLAPAPAATSPTGNDAPVELPSPPASEEEQRLRVVEQLAGNEDILRAGWITHSTLVIVLQDFENDGDALRGDVCRVLRPHDAVRDARVQLQSSQGSSAGVRFMQCTPY